ncbi:MAG: FAD-binding protein, partial [Thermoguttaceae bacterium]
MSNPFIDYKTIVRENVPLEMHTWLQLGGNAEYFAEPRSVDELIALLRIAKAEGMRVRVLGFGANILVPDAGVSGLVVRLTASSFCEIHSDKNLVRAGGGAKLGRVITHSVYGGLAGL